MVFLKYWKIEETWLVPGCVLSICTPFTRHSFHISNKLNWVRSWFVMSTMAMAKVKKEYCTKKLYQYILKEKREKQWKVRRDAEKKTTCRNISYRTYPNHHHSFFRNVHFLSSHREYQNIWVACPWVYFLWWLVSFFLLHFVQNWFFSSIFLELSIVEESLAYSSQP